ncbi:hypothetical protein I7I48_01910 [Histoplasma ohiense]|nr:hypothetical protein I7I48_01910 [Histoplasma ohiense (nom. inval.)]
MGFFGKDHVLKEAKKKKKKKNMRPGIHRRGQQSQLESVRDELAHWSDLASWCNMIFQYRLDI